VARFPEERRRTGKPVLGVAAILAQDPQYRPAFLDRSPAPLFLAASESMWRTLYEAYAWFVAAFRDAAEKLRAGDRAEGVSHPVSHSWVGDRRLAGSPPESSESSPVATAEVCPGVPIRRR
jgi:hypothetical protein